MAVESKRFTLNAGDWSRWLKNALIFAAPALLLLLGDVVKALPEWLNGPALIVVMFAINQLVDLLRKFVQGK